MSRTNLCLQSEDFTTTWAISNSTVTANTAIAPDSRMTADDIIPLDSFEIPLQIITTYADATHTFSIYAKQGNTGAQGWVRIAVQDSAAGNGFQAWFDISNGGAVGTSNAFGVGTTFSGTTTESVGKGWYRVSVTGILATGITSARVFVQNTTVDSGATSDQTASVLWWGAQLEASPAPTAYIPTTTVAVTVADPLQGSVTTYDGSDAIIVARGSKLFDIDVSGISGHTVELQRSPDGGTNWYTVDTYTADVEAVGQTAGIKNIRLTETVAGTGYPIMTLVAGNAV